MARQTIQPHRQPLRPRKLNKRPVEFADHAGNPYTTLIYTTSNRIPPPIPKLSLQLYTLTDLSAELEEIGWQITCALHNIRDRSPRVDIYHRRQLSIEACMEHHQREKQYRKDAIAKLRSETIKSTAREEHAQEALLQLRGKEPLPHIVPTWCTSEKFWREYHIEAGRYRSFILVIPEECRNWVDIRNSGLWMVRFDQDVGPGIETEEYDCDVDEDARIGDRDGWAFISRVDLDPPVKAQRVSVQESLDEIQDNLAWDWRRLIEGFQDCVYRESCEMCREDKPHEECEIELDEHYLDDDMQCVACRRSREYRRRSKRIAKRKAED